MTTKARTPRAGQGALLVVMTLLVGSGLIRIAIGAGDVFAEEGGDAETAGETMDNDKDSRPTDIAAVLDALDKRAARLDEQEAMLADRMAAVKLAEAEIEERLQELISAEERLSELIALSETAAEGDLARLTAVYESMKPKQAAALFEAMTPDFAAGFLGRMRPDAAAAILAGMTAESAYTISVVLAGRNANAPTE